MLKTLYSKLMTFAVLPVMLISAVLTTPALADSGSSNPTPPTSGSGSTRGTHTSSNNLSNVPSGTKVVIVDSQGDKLPLGSQAAQNIVNSGDPIWCPATLSAPAAGGVSGCIADTSLALLFNDFTISTPAANGTIWIDDLAPDSSVSVLSGLGMAMANFTLTLKGGWNGTIGSGTINGTSTFSNEISITDWKNNLTLSNITISGAPSLTGLNITTSKNITLTNVNSNSNGSFGASLDTTYNGGTGSISITGGQFNGNTGDGASLTVGTGGTVTISGTQFNSNIGGGIDGLDISSAGAVTLTNSTANGNNGTGVYIDNTSTGTVTISDTQFNSNTGFGGDGLYVSSAGAVTLMNATATGNGGYGAKIDNSTSSSHVAVTLNGTNTFNTNAGYGLYVESNGAITVNDLTASGNTVSTGATLQNDFSLGAGGVTLTGVNIFNGNGAGLAVASYGAIKANSLIAYGNTGGDGASLANYFGTPLSTQTVTLTGSSQFKNNAGNGLDVSSNGLITANNITAISNSIDGADFNNNNAGVTAGITLTGTNIFNSNASNGLNVTSNGAIKLNSITANGNDTSNSDFNYGAQIDNSNGTSASSVTLTGVNTFNGNYNLGLWIRSSGAVNASSLTANSQQQGAMIQATGAVTLTGSNTFNSNTIYDGLDVYSSGAITTNNLTANGNAQDGVYLNNCNDISGCINPTIQPVTVNGINTFNSNAFIGLDIQSRGAVTTNNLSAAGNGHLGSYQYGVRIDNCVFYSASCTGSGKVTISGANVFDDNYSGGLLVNSKGVIALNSITASFNIQGPGISLDNCQYYTTACTGNGTIALTGTNIFNDNYGDGADLNADGKITASNVTADWNGTGLINGIGLSISNEDGITPAAITLSGANVFTGNHVSGLDIEATGTVTVSNVTANDNGGGIILTNYWLGGVLSSGGSASVSMTNLIASNNAYTGLDVTSHGVITSSGITANSNGSLGSGYGAEIQDSGNTHPSITLSGANTFNNNQAGGLNIQGLGAVTVNNLQASNNSVGYGAEITTGSGAVASPVTLNGFGIFNNNYGDGLSISTYGAITTSNLTANCNGLISGCTTGLGGYGVSLNNSVANVSAPQKVTMNGTNTFNNNYYEGLTVQSIGAISLNNVTANNSAHANGVTLHNTTSGVPGGVTLTGMNTFNDNYNNGLAVYTQGAVVAANLNANSNGKITGYDGVYLDTATASITLTGANAFNDNSRDGLDINNAGLVKLTSVTASNNAWDGFDAITTGNLTVTCGSFTGNGQFGVNTAVGGATYSLIGVIASGNVSSPEITYTGTAPTFVRDCPLP